jgi:cytochrome P450
VTIASEETPAPIHSRPDMLAGRDGTTGGFNPLSLPTSPGRAAAFAEARGTAPFHDRRLGAWIVLDPPSVTRLLQDDRLVVPDVSVALSALEERYAIHLPHLHWASSALPLLANGAHLQEVRRPLAKHLSGEKKGPRVWRERVAGLIAAALAEPRRFDAFRQLLLPIVNAIFDDITGITVGYEPLSLTKIFDRFASFRQIVDLEGKVAALRQKLWERDISGGAEGMLASLVMLGSDSLLSSLSESFLVLATSCRGLRLDELQEIPAPLISGVAIAERMVAAPIDFGDVRFEAGDRVRMYFQGFNALESETERIGFFGTGAHACLGRSLAMDVWSLIAAEMARSPRTVAAVQSEYDRGVVFAMPKYITIELA